MNSDAVIVALHEVADPERARHSARYFKTGPGEYGEGDIFIGVTVPQVRAVARQYRDLPPSDVMELLESREHEVRLCGVILLVNRYRRSRSPVEKSELFSLYLSGVHTGRVNNWDLIDLGAPTFGGFLLGNPDRVALLNDLARSPSLWERRLSIMLTFAFIRVNEFAEALSMAEFHLADKHDLIHKAVGWMLREIGKRDVAVLRAFLEAHTTQMPRTALRYAIEKLDEAERQQWLRRR